MSRREELFPVIKELHEVGGLSFREIGERLGIARSTAQDYYSDPDGSKVWARKHREKCRECGGPVYTGDSGFTGRCRDCVVIWTREAVILAIQEWADEHGGIPPSQLDWNPSHPQANGMHRREWELWRGRLPAHSTVQDLFGSWNAGIAAAGFEPRYKHQTPEVRREAVRRVLAGERALDVAVALGVTPQAVSLWKKDPRYNPERRVAA